VIATLFQILGGLALFLLAMGMMTDGLKNSAGQNLRHLLGAWTKTPLKGFGTGVLITGIVQSSSAVTIATIGFVNAGVLSLRQSLGVVLGANVGTTMTGWLVSLVGFGLRIDTFAMLLLATGVALKLLAPGHRGKSAGEALAGFALFFLALSLLKDSLGGMADDFSGATLVYQGYGLPVLVMFGFLTTLLTQSSSAALAIILTAAAGQLLSLESAAAAVIGANLGTTSTAAIAVLSATANARRLALGHVIFNLITGVIALIILPVMLWLIARFADWFELGANPAVSLALFHTLFNLLGAAIMLPFAPQFADLLNRLFRSQEEDSAEPRYLDNTLVKTPELALAAVDQEMKRLIDITRGLLRVCIDREALRVAQIQPMSETALSLSIAITDYISRLRSERMQASTVNALAGSFRTCRYLTEATHLAPALLHLRNAHGGPDGSTLEQDRAHYLTELRQLIASKDAAPEQYVRVEQAYQRLKSSLLELVVKRALPIGNGERILDDLSAVRRLSDQWHKALNWSASTGSDADSAGSTSAEGEKHPHQYR
jgi:phosphate:Na+ symporter